MGDGQSPRLVRSAAGRAHHSLWFWGDCGPCGPSGAQRWIPKGQGWRSWLPLSGRLHRPAGCRGNWGGGPPFRGAGMRRQRCEKEVPCSLILGPTTPVPPSLGTSLIVPLDILLKIQKTTSALFQEDCPA